MATSTPAPPDDAAPPTLSPRRETLATVSAQVAAIDTLIGLAQQSIRVFDVDLSETGWNDVVRAEKIAAFLRASRIARLEIIVHDTGWIERSCPRLTKLLRKYSHAITIYRTGEGARHAMDPLVIVDGRHFLHRLHISQPRAVLAIEEPIAAQPLVERFEAIWATGEPGVTATILGL
jgi:hypothetical protein